MSGHEGSGGRQPEGKRGAAITSPTCPQAPRHPEPGRWATWGSLGEVIRPGSVSEGVAVAPRGRAALLRGRGGVRGVLLTPDCPPGPLPGPSARTPRTRPGSPGSSAALPKLLALEEEREKSGGSGFSALPGTVPKATTGWHSASWPPPWPAAILCWPRDTLSPHHPVQDTGSSCHPIPGMSHPYATWSPPIPSHPWEAPAPCNPVPMSLVFMPCVPVPPTFMPTSIQPTQVPLYPTTFSLGHTDPVSLSPWVNLSCDTLSLWCLIPMLPCVNHPGATLSRCHPIPVPPQPEVTLPHSFCGPIPTVPVICTLPCPSAPHSGVTLSLSCTIPVSSRSRVTSSWSHPIPAPACSLATPSQCLPVPMYSQPSATPLQGPPVSVSPIPVPAAGPVGVPTALGGAVCGAGAVGGCGAVPAGRRRQ